MDGLLLINFERENMKILDFVFYKLLLPSYVLFIVFLRGMGFISRKRFERLLFDAPEKMSNRSSYSD